MTRYWNKCKLGPFVLLIGEYGHDVLTCLRQYSFEGTYKINLEEKKRVGTIDAFLVDFEEQNCYLAIGKDGGPNNVRMCLGSSKRKSIENCLDDFLEITGIKELDIPESILAQHHSEIRKRIEI
jgi:hypothetical protein